MDILVFDEALQKFFIIDFKTNIIENINGDEQKNLQQLIFSHHYQLQAAIYGLAVHRFLTVHFNGYDIKKHFGGVWFNFIRNSVAGKESYIKFSAEELCLEELNLVFK